MSELSLVELPLRWLTRNSLVMSQHWFKLWLGAIRQQAITWANVDPDVCRHLASLGHNELTLPRSTTWWSYKICAVRHLCNKTSDWWFTHTEKQWCRRDPTDLFIMADDLSCIVWPYFPCLFCWHFPTANLLQLFHFEYIWIPGLTWSTQSSLCTFTGQHQYFSPNLPKYVFSSHPGGWYMRCLLCIQSPIRWHTLDDKSTMVQMMLGAVRQQAITWTNVDQVIWCHIASLRHNG